MQNAHLKEVQSTISALQSALLCSYDMTISDSMYGAAKRYVTRERVEAMLDYEVRCTYITRAQQPRASSARWRRSMNTVMALVIVSPALSLQHGFKTGFNSHQKASHARQQVSCPALHDSSCDALCSFFSAS